MTAPMLKPFSGTDMARITTYASEEAMETVIKLVDDKNRVIGPIIYPSELHTLVNPTCN